MQHWVCRIGDKKGVMFVCDSCEEGLGNLKGTRQIFKDYVWLPCKSGSLVFLSGQTVPNLCEMYRRTGRDDRRDTDRGGAWCTAVLVCGIAYDPDVARWVYTTAYLI